MNHRRPPSIGFIFLACLIGSGCSLSPSDGLVESFVAEENEAFLGKSDPDKTGPRTKKERTGRLIGKEFETYIHDLRGEEDGKANVQNIEVIIRAKDMGGAEIGSRVKVKVTGIPSKGQTVYGEVTAVLGSANTVSRGVVTPGQKYELEIIGMTPAADRYGLIDGVKTYVLGGTGIGEHLTAVILGEDRLAGKELVYFAKKVSK